MTVARFVSCQDSAWDPGSLRRPGDCRMGRRLKSPLRFAMMAVFSAAVASLLLLGLAGGSASASVDGAGAFITEVPIVVPSFHGVQPRLTLRYSSSAGNGWVGVGWDLGGLSRIERVSGLHGVPSWTATDSYTIDGEPLLACSAGGKISNSPSCMYQVAGTQGYTTEIESYRRIAYDPNGATAWKVWQTNGVIGTYQPGLVTDKGVLSWVLTSIKDLSGNEVDYHWTGSGSSMPVISSITYGDVTISFATESRSDPIETGDSDAFVTMSTRLKTVTVAAGGQQLRSYRLTHAQDPTTSQSTLASVQELGSDGTTSFPATQYTTSGDGSLHWGVQSDHSLLGFSDGWPTGPDGAAYTTAFRSEEWTSLEQPLSFDANGDGFGDVVLVRSTGTSNGIFVTLELGKSGGGYREQKQGWDVPWGSPITFADTKGMKVVEGDVNGDGLIDLLFVVNHLDTYRAAVSLGQASGLFTSPRSPVTFFGGGTGEIEPTLFGDITGDGFADIVHVFWGQGCANGGVESLVGDGTGGFVGRQPVCWPSASPPPTHDIQFQLVDVNGDLRSDVVGFERAKDGSDHGVPPSTTARLFSAMSRGDGSFSPRLQDLGPSWAEQTQFTVGFCNGVKNPNVECHTTYRIPGLWMDVNGDGSTDLVLLWANISTGSVEAKVFAGASDGSVSTVPRTLPTPLTTTALRDQVECADDGTCRQKAVASDQLSGDFNGDGLPDLASIRNDVNGHITPYLVEALNNPAGGFMSGSTYPGGWTSPCSGDSCLYTQSAVVDVNGDGNDDVVAVDGVHDASAPPYDYPAVSVAVSSGVPTTGALRTADLNGDGNSDLVAPLVEAGQVVQVRSYLRTGYGDYQARPLARVSVAGAGVFTLRESGWIATDVNGDHLDDLVNLPPAARTGVELLANPDGSWTFAPVTLAALDQTGIQALFPIGLWGVSDVNADGILDLVHVGPGEVLSSGGYPQGVDTPGVLTLAGSPFGLGSAQRVGLSDPEVAKSLGWMAADVNGDGRTDLVKVDTGRQVVTTLMRQGSGWQDIETGIPTTTQPPPAGTIGGTIYNPGGGDPAWTASNANNDSAGDLLRVVTSPDGNSYAETLRGMGDGHWAAQSYLLGDSFDPWIKWRVSDVNADGRTDLVQIGGNSAGGNLIDAVVSENGRWNDRQQNIEDGVGTDQVWRVVPGTGAPDFWQPTLGTDGTLTFHQIAAGVLPNMLLSIDNGLGATTKISYGQGASYTDVVTTPPSQCRLPVGAAPLTVVTDVKTYVNGPGFGSVSLARVYKVPAEGPDSARTLGGIATTFLGDRSRWVEIYDLNQKILGSQYDDPDVLLPPVTLRLPATEKIANPVVTDQSSTRYQCARYSTHFQRFLGWADSWNTHAAEPDPTPGATAPARPASIEHVARSITDGGVIQTVLDETTDTGGDVLQRTTDQYKAVGDAPYIDLLDSTSTGNCDPAGGACAQNTSAFEYDLDGNIISRVDTTADGKRSRTTSIAYLNYFNVWLIGLPRLTTITDTSDPLTVLRATARCFDGADDPECDAGSAHPLGLLTGIHRWNGKSYVTTESITYDAWGNKLTTTDAMGHTSTTTWDDALHLFPVRTCNALHQCTHTVGAWDRSAEAPTESVDPNGAITLKAYDYLGRLKSTTTPSGAETTLSYALGTGGTVEKDTTTAGAIRIWKKIWTDGLGRVYRVQSPSDVPGKVDQTDTVYADGSLPLLSTIQHLASQPATGYDTIHYDALGRPISTTHPIGTAITTAYSTDNGVDVASTTDERGITTTKRTDGWGALVSSSRPSLEHPGTEAATTYEYDLSGDLMAIIDPHGNKHSFDWDKLGRQISDNDPDRGFTAYKYNLDGLVTQTSDARFRINSFRYDKLGRMVARTDAATGAVTSWSYDQADHGSSIGRLTSVQDDSSGSCANHVSESLTYDISGNITKQSLCVDGQPGVFDRVYDGLNRVTRLSYPDGHVVNHTYNHAGNLAGIPGWVSGAGYDGAGRPTTMQYANGATGTWSYNLQNGRLLSQHLTAGDQDSTDLFDQSYGYDPSGLVASIRSVSNDQRQTYKYDDVGDLISVSIPGNGITQSFTYDDLANMITNSRIGAYAYPATRICHGSGSTKTCAGPHAVTSAGDTTYTYDPDGNTLQSTTDGTPARQFTWNTQGQLISLDDATAGTVTNIYNAAGHRVEQTSSAGTVRYYGNLAQHSADGWTDYIYAGNQLVGAWTPSGKAWYASDRLGSVRVLVNGAGKVVAKQNYTPYGSPYAHSGDIGTIGYGGHQSLANTGLIDMAARDYDPKLARMLSADTIIPDVANTAALNRYAYAYNNPTTYNDPSGHIPQEPWRRWQGSGGGWNWWSWGTSEYNVEGGPPISVYWTGDDPSDIIDFLSGVSAAEGNTPQTISAPQATPNESQQPTSPSDQEIEARMRAEAASTPTTGVSPMIASNGDSVPVASASMPATNMSTGAAPTSCDPDTSCIAQSGTDPSNSNPDQQASASKNNSAARTPSGQSSTGAQASSVNSDSLLKFVESQAVPTGAAAVAVLNAVKYASTSATVGELILPLGEVPLSLIPSAAPAGLGLTGAVGITATATLGVIAAGGAGYAVGTIIDNIITRGLGMSLGAKIYDWSH